MECSSRQSRSGEGSAEGPQRQVDGASPCGSQSLGLWTATHLWLVPCLQPHRTGARPTSGRHGYLYVRTQSQPNVCPVGQCGAISGLDFVCSCPSCGAV